MSDDLTLRCAGEQALIAYVQGEDADQVSARVQALTEALATSLEDCLIDLVPSYASVLVVFDALRSDSFAVAQRIRAAAYSLRTDTHTHEGRLVEIPSYYSPESGPDLQAVAEHIGLSIEETVALHSAREYRVYAIGFAPGFAYLGTLDERLALPRLSTPRQRVPRGAIAIADRQTAIYPAPSPGGWRLLGRTAVRMFDPAASAPMPVSVGDRLRFVPVDRESYLAAGGEL